jgi:hypothetical protein
MTKRKENLAINCIIMPIADIDVVVVEYLIMTRMAAEESWVIIYSPQEGKKQFSDGFVILYSTSAIAFQFQTQSRNIASSLVPTLTMRGRVLFHVRGDTVFNAHIPRALYFPMKSYDNGIQFSSSDIQHHLECYRGFGTR